MKLDWRTMSLCDWDLLVSRFFYLTEKRTLTAEEQRERERLGVEVEGNKRAFEEWLQKGGNL